MNSQPSPALISLLESPRARAVNLSYLDDESGKSLLHEAARRKDLRLIELVVRAGADVFVRDRRGKMAYDGLGKDDRVRVFLRQCMFPSIPSYFMTETGTNQLQITTSLLLMLRRPSPQYSGDICTSIPTSLVGTIIAGSSSKTVFCHVRFQTCGCHFTFLPSP